jgi:hypothetical protein
MDAAIEQIDAAIVHFYSGEYACAITLAGAAEDQIVRKEEDHIWERLKRKVPAGESEKQWMSIFNETRNWLKHATPEMKNERYIEEFDCVFMLLRATSKISAHYLRTSIVMDHFKVWCIDHGYITSLSVA